MYVLYLTPFDPKQRDGGGFLRSSLMWKALKEFAEVDTVVLHLDDCGGYQNNDAENIKHVKVGKAIVFKWRLVILRLISLFVKRMDWAFVEHNVVRSWLGCGDKKYDFVVVRYVENAVRAAAWKIAPMVLDVDDLPSQCYWTNNKRRCSLRSLFVYVTIWGWERLVMRQAVTCIFSNKNQLGTVPSGVRGEWVRNVGNAPAASYELFGLQRMIIATVGTFGHPPNREGVNRFLRDVWPFIRKKIPQVEFHIVGRCSDDTALMWGKIDGVVVRGFVDCLEDVYSTSLCTVAPIYSGSGTCVKVIESALFGRRSLVSPFASRGLDAESRRLMGVYVCNAPEDYIEIIKMFIDEPLDERRDVQVAISHYANMSYSIAAFNSNVKEVVCGAW